MDKIELYRAGAYTCPVPGPCPVGWTEQNWIAFIDKYGRWCPRMLGHAQV